MASPLERRLFFLLILTMVWSAAIGVEANGIAPVEPEQIPASCYFSGKPILDVELAKTPECFIVVATQGPADKLAHNIGFFRVNTYMDLLFILLYWGVFVLFARVEEGRWTKWVMGLISVAALFDVLENLRILKGLAQLANSEHLEGLLPRPFSLVKWTLLGLALGLTGILVWSRKGRFPHLLGFALVVSAVLTIVGLGIPHVMVYAADGFALSFVLILARVWPYPADSVLLWIEYAYLLRFQVVAGAILALTLPLAYHLLPSVFVGLFDARGFPSFLFVVWVDFQLAWTIMVTSRLVFVYGPDRFMRATSIQPKRVGAGMVAAFGSLALPVVVVLFIGTVHPGTWSKLLASILGVLLAIGVLALTASLHFAIEDPCGHSAEAIFPSFGFLAKATRPTSKFWGFIASYLARHLPADLTAGILDTTGGTPRLRSGHEMAAIALAVFLLLYAFLGGLFSPAWWNPDREPAAMFFLLVLLAVLTWLFSGAAFFLDRTRLPVLTTLLVVSLLTGIMGTDHKFVVGEKNTADTRLSPSDVINKWKETRGKNSQTILVVATAGGGIRAAAWTAEVMTRLEQDCAAVGSSLVLFSSVSGGSVGSMFVVAPYSGKGEYPVNDEELAAIRFNAKRSSLSAVGWGLAYPDLARTVPVLGSFVPETFDRGWSLENTWATGWREKGFKTPTMKQWREDVRQGLRPAVIFNATSSETGDRFLISSTDTSSGGTERFFTLLPAGDMDVTTAARLSATFPYASPLARPSAGSVTTAYHVGDGGYYDNSGLLSAVEWLRDAGSALQGKTVFLILIDAKPGPERAGSSWSWQKQLVGPLETLLHVRASSQQLRDSIERDMAQDYLASQKDPVKVTTIPFLFATKSPAPLSWHLTKDQIKQIGDSWLERENQEAWRQIREKLTCSTNPEVLKKAQDGSDE
ncbi:MAG TPA: hypothetical protein VK937_05925 [Candidatus Limnocylindria bacterium]|nr:hypothetical protein [Candidatus Limnocylindria bacterium]